MRLSQAKSNPLDQLMSKLYFYYGCMNCGKSLSLLSKAYGFRERGIDVLLIKSTIDTRDSGVIRSRALSVEEQCLPISQEDNVFVKVSQAVNENLIKIRSSLYFYFDSSLHFHWSVVYRFLYF